MKVLEVKITDLSKIDGSKRVSYYAKIKAYGIVQKIYYTTDGVFKPHLTEEEFIEFISE
jgi:hypothetical protein